jgi:hypothetical protein
MGRWTKRREANKGKAGRQGELENERDGKKWRRREREKVKRERKGVYSLLDLFCPLYEQLCLCLLRLELSFLAHLQHSFSHSFVPFHSLAFLHFFDYFFVQVSFKIPRFFTSLSTISLLMSVCVMRCIHASLA